MAYNQTIMLTPYHVQILAEALADYFSPRALSVITTANNYQDRLSGQFGHDEYHVDNDSFKQSNDYMEEQRALVILSLQANDATSAWSAFGRLTHTAHDFYAHSNYVTLWLSRFNGNTPPAPTEIDPVDPNLLNDPDLHSGRVYYPLDVLYYFQILRPFVLSRIPRDSHAWMNLDSPKQGFQFEYAVQAAIKRTAIEFENTMKGLKQDQYRLFVDK